MEYLQLAITGLSVVAAILAWFAKLRWSKEYSDAKEATIAAKDAQIQLLEKQIETYKDLSSVKLHEYLLAVRAGLEAYIDDLSRQVDVLKAESVKKDDEISKLLLLGEQKETELSRARTEKENFGRVVKALEARIATLKPISDNVETAIEKMAKGVIIIDGLDGVPEKWYYDFSKTEGEDDNLPLEITYIFTGRKPPDDQPKK